MKKSILLATSAFFAFGATAANAVDVDMYGQVNKGIFALDNGDSVDVNFMDNDRSSTRFGVRGSQSLANGLTASVLFEGELQSNASDNFTDTNASAGDATSATPADQTGTMTERHTRVGLAGNFGAIFLGKTSTATDGITEIDMAGASDVMGSGIDRIGGGTILRTSNGLVNETYTGSSNLITLGNVWDNVDGITPGGISEPGLNIDGHSDRLNSVRYDSPIFNGLQARVATAQGGAVDGALLYNGKVDAFEVKGGVGYVAYNNMPTGTDIPESSIAGSVSVKHDSGLAGTLAYGQYSLENETNVTDDPSTIYAKLGYSWDAFEVAADYGLSQSEVAAGIATDGTDTSTAGDLETATFGLAGQYNIGNGVSLSGLYRYVEPDVDGLELEEMSFYGVNMRVKF